MGGASGVVAWKDGMELSNTVVISLLETTEKGSVEVAVVVGVAVSTGDDAGVDTSSIAVPEVQIDTGDRLTGGAVDHLDVHVERDTCLFLGDIAADQFAAYIIRSLSNIRCQDTGCVGGEQDRGVRGQVHVQRGFVGSVESSKVASLEERST
jgi:hypothetical protein